VRSHTRGRAWTAARGGSDRPVCALKGLHRPHGAVNPIASLGERFDQFSQSSSPFVSRGGGRAGGEWHLEHTMSIANVLFSNSRHGM
jgi:hypothetical protein